MAFDADRYRVLVDSVAEGVIVYDERGRARLVNEYARSLFGLSQAQLDGRERVDVNVRAVDIDGRDVPIDALPVPTTVRTGRPGEMVVGIDRVGEPRVWLSVRSAPLDGGGVVATIRDAREVKWSHDLDRAALDLATSAVDVPPEHVDEVFSAALGRIGAATYADRVVHVGIDHGRGRAAVAHEWSLDGVELVKREGGVPLDLMATLLGRLTRRERIVVERADDLPPDAAVPQDFFAAWSMEAALAVPLFDEARLVGFVVVGYSMPREIPDQVTHFAVVAAGLLSSLLSRARADRDLRALNESLDDRVRARSLELDEARDRTRALIDAIPDLLFEMDAEGVFVTVHVPHDAGYDVDADGFLGRHVRDVVPPEMAEPVESAMRRLHGSNKLEILEYAMPVDGIEHSYECRLVPRSDGAILAVIRDVSGQAEQARSLREQSAKLTRANEELERALRAKDEFLASISHELRTPLAAILGLTEMLLDPGADDLSDAQRSSLQTIDASGKHLLGLINDLLDLGGLKDEAALEPSTVCAAEVARLCLELVRPLAEQRGLHVEFIDGSDAASLRADERRLRQILLNLLDNASKFTNPGGSLGLQVWTPDGAHVAFAVWDTGLGIDVADHERIFEPFTQLDSSLARRQGGSGLGLALTRQLVTMHGGTIAVESVLGRGARFVVTLPR